MENIDRFYTNCIFLGLLIGVFVFSAQFVINVLDPPFLVAMIYQMRLVAKI